jgi:hypothetical protein
VQDEVLQYLCVGCDLLSSTARRCLPPPDDPAAAAAAAAAAERPDGGSLGRVAVSALPARGERDVCQDVFWRGRSTFGLRGLFRQLGLFAEFHLEEKLVFLRAAERATAASATRSHLYDGQQINIIGSVVLLTKTFGKKTGVYGLK